MRLNHLVVALTCSIVGSSVSHAQCAAYKLKAPTRQAYTFFGEHVAFGGQVLFATSESQGSAGRVYAFDAVTGALVWKAKAPSGFVTLGRSVDSHSQLVAVGSHRLSPPGGG